MRLLLDTHLLLWTAEASKRLPVQAAKLIADPNVTLVFSAISILEIAIKHNQACADFEADPLLVRSELLANGYEELPVLGQHAVAVAGLPPIHKDPFDRLLVAQATIEGILLLTADKRVAAYPGPVRRV